MSGLVALLLILLAAGSIIATMYFVMTEKPHGGDDHYARTPYPKRRTVGNVVVSPEPTPAEPPVSAPVEEAQQTE
jgi:hypothetical protein